MKLSSRFISFVLCSILNDVILLDLPLYRLQFTDICVAGGLHVCVKISMLNQLNAYTTFVISFCHIHSISKIMSGALC